MLKLPAKNKINVTRKRKIREVLPVFLFWLIWRKKFKNIDIKVVLN
jgi:hypothetical protein